MTTYVYEVIPSKSGQKPRYVEIKQSMKDAPLTKHPETGEAIRRVISGGFGSVTKGNAKSSSGSSARSGAHTHSSSCGCRPGKCG